MSKENFKDFLQPNYFIASDINLLQRKISEI